MTAKRLAASASDSLIAQRLVEARRASAALKGFPGAIPDRLEESYAIQNAAIDLWGEPVIGWKVGRVPDPLIASLGADRLIGAIFPSRVWPVTSQTADFPVFVGGFAAVEAEFVYRLGRDAPADQTEWTQAQALDLVASMHLGVEIAGSPIPDINGLGPTVVAADFGNNSGLLLGAEVSDWRSRSSESLVCRTEIDGKSVGENNAASLPGGPPQALAFALTMAARIGRPMRAGALISSGAVTGVHEVESGARVRVVFNGLGEISCRAVPARRYEEDQDVSTGKGAAR